MCAVGTEEAGGCKRPGGSGARKSYHVRDDAAGEVTVCQHPRPPPACVGDGPGGVCAPPLHVQRRPGQAGQMLGPGAQQGAAPGPRGGWGEGATAGSRFRAHQPQRQPGARRLAPRPRKPPCWPAPRCPPATAPPPPGDPQLPRPPERCVLPGAAPHAGPAHDGRPRRHLPRVGHAHQGAGVCAVGPHQHGRGHRGAGDGPPGEPGPRARLARRAPACALQGCCLCPPLPRPTPPRAPRPAPPAPLR